MSYQYKREPLSDDEVNRLTNTCESFEEKFALWPLLDTVLRVSEFANLKKDNIQWQERRLIMAREGLTERRPSAGRFELVRKE